jgi:hypothetical protein
VGSTERHLNTIRIGGFCLGQVAHLFVHVALPVALSLTIGGTRRWIKPNPPKQTAMTQALAIDLQSGLPTVAPM